MRAFLAIELPDQITSALSEVALSLPVGRTTSEENLHLTLAFLGDQSDTQLEDLHYELAEISVQEFELSFDGLGTFGTGAPKVLFARIAENKLLADLHQQVKRAASELALCWPGNVIGRM